jgi:hypothetical protein
MRRIYPPARKCTAFSASQELQFLRTTVRGSTSSGLHQSPALLVYAKASLIITVDYLFLPIFTLEKQERNIYICWLVGSGLWRGVVPEDRMRP